jgi:hypothetical protein
MLTVVAIVLVFGAVGCAYAALAIHHLRRRDKIPR